MSLSSSSGERQMNPPSYNQTPVALPISNLPPEPVSIVRLVSTATCEASERLKRWVISDWVAVMASLDP